MNIPLSINVNQGSMKAFKVPLKNGQAHYIEVQLTEVPFDYSAEVPVSNLTEIQNSGTAASVSEPSFGGTAGGTMMNVLTNQN